MGILGWIKNLGFGGSPVTVTAVAGPYRSAAAQTFQTGSVIGQTYHTGAAEGETFQTGAVVGETSPDG